jgi:AcrR family transcriptional regulator
MTETIGADVAVSSSMPRVAVTVISVWTTACANRKRVGSDNSPIVLRHDVNGVNLGFLFQYETIRIFLSMPRPRSQASRAAILTAAQALLSEKGFSALTIEGVAARAKAGKATIYRWWPDRASLAADALLSATFQPIPVPDTGSAREDFRRHMQLLSAAMRRDFGQQLLVALACTQENRDLTAAFRNSLWKTLRLALAPAIHRAAAARQIRPNVYAEVLFDLLYGPVILRFLTAPETLTPDYVDALCETVMTGILPA